jgi:hypothetical protein
VFVCAHLLGVCVCVRARYLNKYWAAIDHTVAHMRLANESVQFYAMADSKVFFDEVQSAHARAVASRLVPPRTALFLAPHHASAQLGLNGGAAQVRARYGNTLLTVEGEPFHIDYDTQRHAPDRARRAR